MNIETVTHAACCACSACGSHANSGDDGFVVRAAATGFTFSMDLTLTRFNTSNYVLADFEQSVREAFATWSSVANIDFREDDSASGFSHIDVVTSDSDAYSNFDGWGSPGGTIGVGGSRNGGRFAWQDAAETWQPNSGNRNYFLVAAHEIGHALGLSHTEGSLQLMNPIIFRQEGIYDRDIADIVARFGEREWTDDAENVFLKYVQVGQTVEANGGNDTIVATDMADMIYGGAGDDDIDASDGNDMVFDTLGRNTIDAGDDNDVVVGGAGTTIAQGGAGNDILIGGKGDDTLNGGDGNDTLRGDPQSSFFHGDDVLIAGRGNDFLEGGGGSDRFVFRPGEGTNTIAELSISGTNSNNTSAIGVDFESGVDVIDLSAFNFASRAEAFGNVSDVHGHAQFSDGGTVIIFYGLDADDLSQNDFLV